MTRVLCGGRYWGTSALIPSLAFSFSNSVSTPTTPNIKCGGPDLKPRKVMVVETFNFPALHFNLQEEYCARKDS
jgi:hypothetical protein